MRETDTDILSLEHSPAHTHPTPEKMQQVARAARLAAHQEGTGLLPECQGGTACRRHRSPWPSPRSASHASSRRSFPEENPASPGATPCHSFQASRTTRWQLVGIPPGCRPHGTTRLRSPRDSEMRGPHHTARILLSTISRTVILDKNTKHPRVGTECGVLTLGFCPVSGRRRSSSSSPVAARPSPPATSQKRARSELCASETLTRTPAASP